MIKHLYEISGFTVHGDWFVGFGIFRDINKIPDYFRDMDMNPHNINMIKQAHRNSKEGIISFQIFNDKELINLLQGPYFTNQ